VPRHDPHTRKRRRRFDDDERRTTRTRVDLSTPDGPTDDGVPTDRATPPDDGPRSSGHLLDLTTLDGRAGVEDEGPPFGDRWSSWDGAEHGPEPRPAWVITDDGAVDTELGVLKTGKEADVHLVERAMPGTDRSVLMAAKRYRTARHRMFHRDAGYLEGRRVRRSREARAMATRTEFGRDLISGQWAGAEFAALSLLWRAGLPVPYPVQHTGTELLIEYLGTDDGRAAPRLAQLRPPPDELADLWAQLVDALVGLARHGLAHGDLSSFNLLVHEGRLIVIDLPQVVDVVGNPNGPQYLARDVRRVGEWFSDRGLPPEVGDAESLLDELLAEIGIRGPRP
jgi:RIO kinase 1